MVGLVLGFASGWVIPRGVGLSLSIQRSGASLGLSLTEQVLMMRYQFLHIVVVFVRLSMGMSVGGRVSVKGGVLCVYCACSGCYDALSIALMRTLSRDLVARV